MSAIEHPINEAGHLTIGGVDAVTIAREFQTPVIVYDVADVRRRARAFHAAFAAAGVSYQIAYASKALSILAMYQVVLQENLYVDVVSGGELFTALQAGVPAARIHFHGNNKSDAEMRYGLMAGVGCFVVDNMREVARLPTLAAEVFGLTPKDATGFSAHGEREENEMKDVEQSAVQSNNRNNIDRTSNTCDTPVEGVSAFPAGQRPSPASPPSNVSLSLPPQRVVRVLLRVAPGVTAHTHAHNTTGQVDSKFGLDIASGQATEAFHTLSHFAHVQVIGLHCHIGSQIFQAAGHVSAAQRLLSLMDSWKMTSCVLNVGGGYGVRYTTDDKPLPLGDYVHAIVAAAQAYRREHPSQLELPSFWIEPGRSLVSEAGTTLYTVGSQKTVPGVRTYLAVDGGISDNIRPVTYQAVYSAALANRMAAAPADHTYNVVGKLCESGDQLIRDAVLPEARDGDILAVFCTGAYCYAMASNYNKMCRPAIVFAENGAAKLVVRRETPLDLIRNELPYSE